MRVITWNLRRAHEDSPVWKELWKLKPDMALLQEVGGIPGKIGEGFDLLPKNAINKRGKPQRFCTVVLINGEILEEITLRSEYDWVNQELELLKGNFVACKIQLQNNEIFNVISVYSPAWPLDQIKLKGVNVSPVKLTENPRVYATEILWSALKNSMSGGKGWIVGGDFNSSETFDRKWQDTHDMKFGLRSTGNREFLERMNNLGFSECLREYHGKIIPTFKHSRKEIVHQIDHLFVTKALYSRLIRCNTGDQSIIFGQSLSDHVPIIADFTDPKERRADETQLGSTTP